MNRAHDLVLLLVAAILRGHGGDNWNSGRSYDITLPSDFLGLTVEDPCREDSPTLFIEVGIETDPAHAICALDRPGYESDGIDIFWNSPDFDDKVDRLLEHLWPKQEVG